MDIDNTQFLDMVKVLPQLFKPTQQKLQMTKTSLQVRHHRPLKLPKLKQKQKHPTTLQYMMTTKLSQQRFCHCYENGLIKTIQTIPHKLYVSFKLTSLCRGLRLILVYPNPQ